MALDSDMEVSPHTVFLASEMNFLETGNLQSRRR